MITTPVLNADMLYIGDNGRIHCGALACAGMTAHFTGLGLGGAPVEEMTAVAHLEWIGETGNLPRCEQCGKECPPALEPRFEEAIISIYGPTPIRTSIEPPTSVEDANTAVDSALEVKGWGMNGWDIDDSDWAPPAPVSKPPAGICPYCANPADMTASPPECAKCHAYLLSHPLEEDERGNLYAPNGVEVLDHELACGWKQGDAVMVTQDRLDYLYTVAHEAHIAWDAMRACAKRYKAQYWAAVENEAAAKRIFLALHPDPDEIPF